MIANIDSSTQVSPCVNAQIKPPIDPEMKIPTMM
jgi:hypothetical protein